ncbi:fatty-acid amide hydrolase 2-A-like isoform X1 [Diorhabda carinulata]|uniref:fatty-acid amide hydrolase 2-A-like isoform X1 n=1 Tax=Diorhabda carinulata TaxID=1163345 RepID=UPI0025A12BB4|nr:fatty-acid amide hydrolase 2-A-like isoform X1 [Diorhabda carinulata]XP_057653699.1 fatty-acid amide hydrolase 2-A-like isoform X1 [Diorhabda carinulata]XP_057653701.1 fatty-acid amide hydrolase 2-A-like isoform X1 [Diorhabda carinulata]
MSNKKNEEVKKHARKRVFCDYVKSFLLKIFLFTRYYVDILIDRVFGYFNDSKRVPIKKCTNPIILESATALARKIRKREYTSEQVVQAFVDRIKEVNPILNALVDSRYEAALEEARKIDEGINNGTISYADFRKKPFLGVPFTTKESSAVKGLSFTLGIVKRKGRKALFDADHIALMKQAGAICLGVTNVPQLNLWQETHNPIYGITSNPYNNTRNVGGSSGGEASLLAAGGTPISLGTDIGGSIRIPAFMCGVFGHKPTSHLISTKGTTFRLGTEAQTIVVMGILARHAVDITPLLKVLTDVNSSKLRLDESVNVGNVKINYITDPKDVFVSPFRKDMTKIFDRVVNYFREISSTEPEELHLEGTKYSGKLWKYWMSQESGVDFMKDITDRTGKAHPVIDTIKYFTVGNDYTLSTIFNFINKLLPCPKDEWAKEETEKLKNQLIGKLGTNGVLLYPSAPFTASYHHASYLRPWNFNFFVLWNVLKFPVTQVPLGLSDGLPVGIQVVAAPYQDHLCIAVAKELEKAFGGYVPPFETS